MSRNCSLELFVGVISPEPFSPPWCVIFWKTWFAFSLASSYPKWWKPFAPCTSLSCWPHLAPAGLPGPGFWPLASPSSLSLFLSSPVEVFTLQDPFFLHLSYQLWKICTGMSFPGRSIGVPQMHLAWPGTQEHIGVAGAHPEASSQLLFPFRPCASARDNSFHCSFAYFTLLFQAVCWLYVCMHVRMWMYKCPCRR